MTNTASSIDIQSVFKIVHDAVATGNWWPLATIALILLGAFVRRLAMNRMGKVGAWLATDHGAILLTGITAVVGGLANSLLAGVTPSQATLRGALLAGGAAVLAFPTVRKLIKSWFGIDLGIPDHLKNASVETKLDGSQKVRPAAVPKPVIVPDPPRRAEGGRVTLPLLMILAALAGMALVSLGGCGLSWPSIVRISATSLNRGIIIGAPMAEERIDKCIAEGDAILATSNFPAAHAKKDECEKLRTDFGAVLTGGKTAATGALLAADEGEKLQKKNIDYAGLLAPVLEAGSKLVRLFKAAGLKPPHIEGVN